MGSEYNTPSPLGMDFNSGGPLHNSYVRDHSTSRGRNQTLGGIPTLNPPPQQLPSRALSPRIGTPGEEAGSRPGTATERRRSREYGHNRKTSIIEGLHHSRNNSYDSPQHGATSPQVSTSQPDKVRNGYVNDLYDYRTAIISQNPSLGSISTYIGSPPLGGTNFSNNSSFLNLGGEQVSVASSNSETFRRDHSRKDSKPQFETRPVVDYALHHLFNSFVGRAEHKMEQCVTGIPHTIRRIEDVCGSGVDKDFDALVVAMGHIARQKPRTLVDTIMFWRRSKSKEYQDCQHDLLKARDIINSRALQRHHNQSASSHNRDTSTEQTEDTNVLVEKVVQAERKLSLAIYLICRVLVEVYQQSDLKFIGEALDKKLQDLIFDQMSRLDAEKVYNSAFYSANWNMYGQLIHEMSSKSFASSSRHFIERLKKLSDDLKTNMPSKDGIAKTAASNEVAARLEMLVRALSYMTLSTRESQWRDTCDFMLALSDLFANCHGQRIKDAYCHSLEILLLPIAANNPPQILAVSKWKEFLSTTDLRLTQMLAKPRYWNEASPLHNLLFCVSPAEVFAHRWQQSVSALHPKLKDRATRGLAIQSIARLLWTYLERNTDSTTLKKKLEETIKLVLPSGKRQPMSVDMSSSDAIVEIARMVAHRFTDFCFEKMVFPLMNYELFASGREIKVEQLEPDRIVIGIRVFLAVLGDLESRDKGPPPFPAFDLESRQSDPLSSGTVSFLRKAGVSGLGINKEDFFLKSVVSPKLDIATAGNFAMFREVLGKITILCNSTFGGHASLDEKSTTGQTPKTPMAESFSFGRRDDLLTPETRQAYYDLLHVAIQALPKCYSSNVPFKTIINLLCTASAHPHTHIAASAAASLKAIARRSNAQVVTIGFGRYLFDFDSRYWGTVSDDGLLGPTHIQSTLKLYVELLKIWIAEIKQKKNMSDIDLPVDGNTSNRALQLELTNTSALVEEIESHGFFFLCAQSRSVRTYAVTILQLITDFDAALGRQAPRIIHILDGDIYQAISTDDDRLTVAERSKLEKGKRKGSSKIGLVELCSSEVSYETTLWFKIFPNIVKLCFTQCQITVTMGRNIVCTRLLHMHKIINAIAEGTKVSQMALFDRMLGRPGTTPQDNIIEQWKLYLVTACTTLTNAGAQTQSQLQHARSKSKPGSGGGAEQLTSARSLFSFVIPLMSAESSAIREAIVIALGSINTAFYRTLLESLQYAVTTCNEAAKPRGTAHQRSGSASRQSTDRLRTEVTHVYRLTSKFLQEEEISKDDWIIRNLVTYTNSMKRFLSDSEVQSDGEYSMLRRHYCGLVEEVYEALRKLPDSTAFMSFDDRKATFTLVEEWSGYLSASGQPINQDTLKEPGQTAALEIARIRLRNASLGAMSSLCAGPISVSVYSEGRQVATASFDVNRIMAWAYQIFDGQGDMPHRLGQRALKNLIMNNKAFPNLLGHVIDMCFKIEKGQALQSYFEIVSRVLTEHEDYPIPFWRVVVLIMCNMGHEDGDIRIQSAKLLRVLEQRQQKNSKLQDFDISIADKTTAVYKQAQFDISRRLAKYYSEDAFFVFSQFAAHFKTTNSENQRNMIVSILPWIQVIELKVDTSGSPTSQTYMFLANLLEITTKSPTSLHNEVQATWQALATGPHGGNVQVVLDFVISLCIDRREQSFVAYAKQIVVFLSITQAGQKVVDFLLLQITPKNMVHSEKSPMDVAPDVLGLPYIADIGEALPIGNKQAGFSLGQLSLILLVDLIVPSVKLSKEHVPLLLQVCLVLWDHYTILVQEQAREMLVHLIHELVLSKIEDNTDINRREIEDFVDDVRQSKVNISWTYQESNSRDNERNEPEVPAAMGHVTNEVIKMFSLTYPSIQENWAKTTLNWATSCSVRHLACRSFQLFRCMHFKLDHPMLADMLARLSNTIADESADVQSFSMEILATLKTVIRVNEATDLLRYPQLFWVTCACLNTVNEREFIETLNLLDALLTKVDLSDPAVVRILIEAQPIRWEGEFEGVMPLIYKGLKSGNSITKTLEVINKTAVLPDSKLVGDDSRTLFSVLANLPLYLRMFEPDLVERPDISSADVTAMSADQDGHRELALVLSNFSSGHYTSKNEFLLHILGALQRAYFQVYELQTLIFLIGLLTNKLPWFLLNTIDILQILVPQIDMRKPEVASLGPDLISPLLRLLQTQYCPHALKVMDHIMYLYSNTNDRQFMRMSMVAAGSRSLRKEYNRTKSLYGIPEESGWSIPEPAVHSDKTRANVHAVFYTCLNKDGVAQPERSVTPEIEFDMEEFQQGSYFPMGRSNTIHSEDYQGSTPSNSDHDDIVARLDSLDDIFDDDPDSENKYLSTYSDVTITGYKVDSERTASIYDLQTAPIVERATMTDHSHGRARAPSTGSFHNSYDNDRHQSSDSPTYKQSSENLTRPTLHSRSITSPSNPIANLIGSMSSGPEPEVSEELFSDDERSINRDVTAGYESFIRRTRSTTKRPMADGKEYHQGDLLRGQARLRSKSQAPNSPEVPKVPEAYLVDTRKT